MNNFGLFLRGIHKVGFQGCKKVKIEPASIYHHHNDSSRKCSTHTASKPEQFRLDKCLLVSKMTKYEYERHRHQGRTEEQLQKLIVERGTDYSTMMSLHRKQKAFEMEVAQQLRDMGIQVQVVNRLTYTPSLIEWCDAVVPCGGDGTFLLAASKVTDSSKPVIGFNSDPQRSVGRLCLPKWCSNDIRGAILCLKEGRFRWLHRTRIRTEVSCDNCINGAIAPLDLHTPQLSRYAGNNWYDSSDHNPEMQAIQTNHNCENASSTGERYTKVLPYLALNEVFIGENISARVSHFRVTVDGGVKAPPTDTKSSGLCITTGTGSTSWHLSINCLRTQSVQELLRLVSEGGAGVDASPAAARAITEKYNQNLIFSPEERRLSYSVRELITSEEWPVPKGLRPRDLATSLHVKSRCIDAGLVIDGGVSFPFNDGTEALLTTRPEDALKCVTMEEI